MASMVTLCFGTSTARTLPVMDSVLHGIRAAFRALCGNANHAATRPCPEVRLFFGAVASPYCQLSFRLCKIIVARRPDLINFRLRVIGPKPNFPELDSGK